VRHEVLEDDLLQMAMALMQGRERFQRFDPLLLRLADADEDAAREGNFQLAGGFDGCEALSRMLGRRAGVDRVHQALGDRLEHQALGSGHFAESGEILAVEDADVRVRKQAALESAFAAPDDVRGEVVVAPFGKTGCDYRVHLGPLPCQDQ
jgi:hypothetical protein